MPSDNSGSASARLLFEAPQDTVCVPREQVAGTPVTRLPERLHPRMMRRVAAALTTVLPLTEREALAMLLHDTAKVRAELWGSVPTPLIEEVEALVRQHAVPDIHAPLCPPAATTVATTVTTKPRPAKTRKPRVRLSVQEMAREALDKLPSALQPLLQDLFFDFLQRAFSPRRYRTLRLPARMSPAERRKAMDYVQDADPRLVGYLRWLSTRFTKHVSAGQLGPRSDDWEDLVGEGQMQIWAQFVRVWADKGDSTAVCWDAAWDDDVVKLEHGSADTLIRHIAKRRGASQRLGADRAITTAYLNMRRDFLQSQGRNRADALTVPEGLRTAARAFASYRRGRLCTGMLQGSPIRMQFPPLHDVVRAWLDGEAAVVSPDWRHRSLDAPVPGRQQDDGSLGAMLSASGANNRELDGSAVDFAQQTLVYLQSTVIKPVWEYWVHCVAGVTRRDHWWTREDFVEHLDKTHEMHPEALEWIVEELERVLRAWFERVGIHGVDVRRLIEPTDAAQRGLFGKYESVMGMSHHQPVEHDDAAHTSARKRSRVTHEEAVAYAQRLTTSDRAMLEQHLARYHEWVTLTGVTWMGDALRREGVPEGDVHDYCQRALRGTNTRELFPDDGFRRVLAGHMRESMRVQESANRLELAGLDAWWPEGYRHAYTLLRDASVLSPGKLTVRDRMLVIRHAVTLARQSAEEWLHVPASDASTDMLTLEGVPLRDEDVDDVEADAALHAELRRASQWHEPEEAEAFAMQVVTPTHLPSSW